MPHPKHHNPSRPDRTAQAPYNFVPLPEKALPAPDELLPQDRYYPGEGERHTGAVECVLTTWSPLYTRCGVSVEQAGKIQAKDLPDFFTNPATSEPAIPGSSLRGMFRTLVEIASHGKLTGVTQRQLFFRTVDESRVGMSYRARVQDQVMGGIFRQEGDRYSIEPCIVGRVWREEAAAIFGLADWLDLYEARHAKDPNMTPKWAYQYRKVWVGLHPQAGDNLADIRPVQVLSKERTTEASQEAILVLTGNIQRKKKEFVFIRHSHQQVLVPDEVYKAFHRDDQITQWQERAFPKDQSGRSLRSKNGALRDGDPVFFLPAADGAVAFLGHAGHFRLPYEHSPAAMVPPDLRRSDMVDLADAIFGYVDLQTEQSSRGGRVFFSDAVLDGPAGDIWLGEVTPRVLSGPKPTAIQLYLTQARPDDSKQLFHYDSNPETESAVRGHKLYWHQGDRHIQDIAEDGDRVTRYPKQYTRIRPVKSGVRFRFTVQFENLSLTELGALLWLLKVAADPAYRLKLGMGKPLGLGAVEIAHTLHLTDRQSRYARLLDDAGGWATGETAAEPVTTKALEAFSAFILNDPVLNPRQADGHQAAQHLEDLPRIRALLTMLAWPGPDPIKTSYMTDLRLDFASRKVLPTPGVAAGLERPPAASAVPAQGQPPLQRRPETGPSQMMVGGRPITPPPPARRSQQAETRRPADTRAAPAPRVDAARPAEAPVSAPVRAAKPVQPIVEAEVTAITGSYITVSVAERTANVNYIDLPQPGRDDKERRRLYPAGRKLRVQVLGETPQGRLRVRVVGFTD